MTTPAEFWDERYSAAPVWSGHPNAALVREAAGLQPGDALDVGCGEGGDAVWLAEQGWRVTAVDVSGSALARGARQAEHRGLGDRIRWLQADLNETLPSGDFDLVTCHFLHSPVDLDRARILAALPALVRPGGTLLVVGHAEYPPWAHLADHDRPPLPRVDEVLADLDLGADWVVEVAATVERTGVGPDGRPGRLVDVVIRARSRPDPA